MPKPPSPKARAAPTVISLKVTLRGSKPPIWRRILVAGTMTLGRLHDAIQAAMGWTDSHLHAFKVGDRHYGDPRHLEGAAEENGVTLDRLIKSGIDRFGYTYDFGDDWDHLVVIENATPRTANLVLPVCVAGRRRCPPDDCGGIWGYAELLDILADPTHPDHAERRDEVGEGFDPGAFDLKGANAALGAAFPKRQGRGVWMRG